MRLLFEQLSPIMTHDRLATNAARAYMVCAATVLAVGVIGQGYFYPTSFAPAALLLMVLLLCLLLLVSITGIAMTSRQIRSFIPLLFPFVAALGYSIALLLEPASVQGTWTQLFRYSAYGSWGILLVTMVRAGGVTGERTWRLVIAIIGWLLSLGSMLMLYGWLPYDGGVMTSSNVELSAIGFRLAGWLQYPNALGAVAGAFGLYHAERLMRAKTQEGFAAEGASLLLHLCVLALTESRGAWLTVLVVAAAHALLCWRKCARARAVARKLKGAVNGASDSDRGAFAGLHAASAAWTSVGWALWFSAFAVGAASATAKAWLGAADWISLPLLAALVCSVGIGLYARAHMQRTSNSKLWTVALLLIAAALAVGAALWLLPTDSGSRLSGHYTTVSARTLFYKDALHLWLERPWFGSGGDSWRQQFASIQSEPYVGKEVHSALVNLLLDIGLIGTVLTLLLVVVALVRAWHYAPGAGMAAAVLLGHSMLDFDMAYGIVALLTMTWLAEGWFQTLNKCDQRSNQRVHRSRGMTIGLAVLLLIPVIGSACQIGGQALYAAGVQRSDPELLQAAIRLAPANTELRIMASLQLPPLEAFALLQAGERYERRGVQLQRELAHAARRSGQQRLSAAYWLAAVSCDRYDSKLQTEAIHELASMAHDASRQGKPLLATELARSALEHFACYEGEVQRLQALPHVANDKRFALTPEARQAAASVYSLSFDPAIP